MITERDVVIEGRRMHYRTAGSGPLLLFLHALGETSLSWQWVLPSLAVDHRVLAPDLPGFGDSERLSGEPTARRLVDVVADFLDACAVERATVVGSSFGGSVAVSLASERPERVARLVLISSTGLGRYVHPALRLLCLPGYGELAIAAGRSPAGAAQRAWLRLPLLFSNPGLAPPAWLAEQYRVARLPHHLATTLAALRTQVSPFGQRQLMLSQLSRLDIPVLLVWGADDVVLPLWQGQAAARRLQHGELNVIGNSGHLPYLERPERVVAAVDHFLGATG